jgi:50S ribosomal subunit-associated GTPase HflX
MNDGPTLQSIAQQLESRFMQIRAELEDLTAKLRAVAADRRRQRQSRSDDAPGER